MDPRKYAETGTEHSIQVAVFMWAGQQVFTQRFPELRWMHAIPNGGERNNIVAARMKAEGVRSGVSDISLPVPRQGYNGFYMEMKKPGGKETDKQKEFGAFVTDNGYYYICCDNYDDAITAIEWYLQ